MEDHHEEEGNTKSKTGEVKVKDLLPFFGVCCFIVSCYTALPDCLGAVCENTLCCFNTKAILCKKSKEKEALCKCCSVDIRHRYSIIYFMLHVENSIVLYRVAFVRTSDEAHSMPLYHLFLHGNFSFNLFYEYKVACKWCAEVRDLVKLIYAVDGAPYDDDINHQWVEICDPTTYELYYFNKYTGVSQWERPPGFN